MATRSIVTSQPDVACDVCGRRLLRGEQPDLFLAAGQPRMVCELCAPRAAHQGWKRTSEAGLESHESLAPRRGRRLFERLRSARSLDGREPSRGYEQPLRDGAAPYDLFADAHGTRAVPVRAPGGSAAPVHAGAHQPELERPPAPADGPLQLAVDVFNASEYTRRVASLARSLGAPEVTVRPGEAVASCIVVVLAWELCWYSYEVDLDDMTGAEVRAIAQGTELSELAPHDRLANALADERGALALL